MSCQLVFNKCVAGLSVVRNFLESWACVSVGDKNMVFPKRGVAVSEHSRKEMKISVLAMACRLLCYQCSWEQLGMGADVVCCQLWVLSSRRWAVLPRSSWVS